MSKKSRNDVISELNALSGFELQNIENTLNEYWKGAFFEYGGLEIADFKDAVYAGEFLISEFGQSGNNIMFPRLKVAWDDNVKNKKTSSYVLVVDGRIAKIGALKDGVKGNSFSQYLSGISGSPSRRSMGVYTFISAMLKSGKRVQVYHVTMDGVVNETIPTIDGEIRSTIHFAPNDIEKANLDAYKKKSGGSGPYLNLKERNATYPKEFDVLYDLVGQRIMKTKTYVA